MPGPDDSVINPTGVVSVRDLPEFGPRPTDSPEKPHRAPDSETLNATKQAFGQSHNAPPPGPSTLASPATTTVTPAAGALFGLRRSESGGWIPPDTQVAVGPSHIFQAVNLEGRIWNKSDKSIAKTINLNSFFGFSTSTNLSDPKIWYDAVSGRWFVAIISYNNSFTQGAWNLAVSKTGDPTGAFVTYTISTSKSAPDFPALALNDDKVVLTANAFRANSFLGTEFVVINKSELLAGGSAHSSYFGPPQGLFTIQPGHARSPCAISGCPLYMAAVAFNSASSIKIWKVQGVPGVGTGVMLFTVSGISISSLTSSPDAKQLGTSTLIATNDNRLLEATYRGDASGGALWVPANSACVPSGDTATRACLRFMKLSISSGGAVTKLQDFDFGQSGFYYSVRVANATSGDVGCCANTIRAARVTGEHEGSRLEHAEPLRLDPEGHVELRPEVLERDRGGQLHDLRLGEVSAHPREELVADPAIGDRHRLSERDGGALGLGVESALGRAVHLPHLLLRRSRLHPTGCIDVDSERAAVDQRDAQVDERAELRRQEPRALHGRRELLGGFENAGGVRLNLRRVEDEAERLRLLLEDLAQGRIVTGIEDLADAGHVFLLHG